MESSRFSIIEATRNAYAFVGREIVYLIKVGAIPMAVQVMLSLFVQYGRKDASAIETYLWGLPATLLFAWFTFIEMRLLLLDERMDRLPPDRDYLLDRQQDMKISVIISLLVNMGFAFSLQVLLALVLSKLWGTNVALTVCGVMMLGGIVWGLRFMITPVLAAVHYPIRPVLRQIWGMAFSFRLFAMGLLFFMPVKLVFEVVTSLFIGVWPPDPDVLLKLTGPQQMAVNVLSAPMMLLLSALFNAGVAYALKQVLGTREALA